MSSSRTGSVASTSSASSVPQPKEHRVNSFCVEKGKWYDCLRPTTTPYQGFGGIANFSKMSSLERQAGTEDTWTQEIYGKMKTSK